mmetsp:Transcript_73060/g.152539  ORF Transcript_73060/g.152539 Transcript_73060/m.152539 type:complete len:403 (-) Transcript_73060:14-1222(-)
MGGGASSRKKPWQRSFHLTSNVEDDVGDAYIQVFPVWSIAITRNQRQLASATSDNRINLWCLVTHQLLIPLVGHADTIWKLAYSPDDLILASASSDGTVRLWEVASGLPVMTLPRNHANWVQTLAWAPDGSRFATGGSDARILIWDVAEAVDAAARLADVAAQAEDAGDYEAAYFQELQEEERQKAEAAKRPLVYWQAHEKSVLDMAFAPSEPRQLVSVGAEGTVAIWDSETGLLDSRLAGHIGAVNCCAISPINEELIATGGEDHTVRLWDLSDVDPGSVAAKSSREKPLGLNLAHFTLKGHQGGIAALKFCGDGKLLASTSKDCDVRIWIPDLKNPTLLAKFPAHEAWVRDLQWTSDQKYIYTAATDGMIYAWEVPRKHHASPWQLEKALKGPARYKVKE